MLFVNNGQLQQPFSPNFEMCFIPDFYLMRSQLLFPYCWQYRGERPLSSSLVHETARDVVSDSLTAAGISGTCKRGNDSRSLRTMPK